MRKGFQGRSAALVVVLLTLAAGALSAATYSTTFPLAENPLSEGGRWIGGKTAGLDWADVATAPGLAHGLQTGFGGYDDSTAVLSGTWGPSQSVTATVHSVHQTGGIIYEEVEIRLRSTISRHRNTGYEINFRCLQGSAAYVQIVRWNGPLGSFTYLDDEKGKGVSDGDVIRATIQGSLITAYINGVQVAQARDDTFTDGSPGMGFFVQGAGDVNADYGFTRFAASDEPEDR